MCRRYVCKICNKILKSRHCMEIHMRNHRHQSELNGVKHSKFDCDFCQKKLKYRCDECGKVVSSQQALDFYTRRWHLPSERIKCVFVNWNQTFVNTKALKVHCGRKHDTEKWYGLLEVYWSLYIAWKWWHLNDYYERNVNFCNWLIDDFEINCLRVKWKHLRFLHHSQ